MTEQTTFLDALLTASRRVTYRIEGKLPGLNELVRASSNHYARSAMKRRYGQAAVAQLRAQRAKPIEALPVDVVFTWTCKNKRRDPDNIASAGQKILLDALQSADVLPGDGWNQIRRISHRFEIGAQDCVEITLTEQCADDD